MNLLAALLLCTVPHEIAVRDSVDLIERNSFYDGDGRQVFQQEIGWDWDGYQHRIVFWRLNKGTSFQEHPPQLTWFDGRRLRQVKASYWRETHYQWGEEIWQRELLPACRRRGLMGEKP